MILSKKSDVNLNLIETKPDVFCFFIFLLYDWKCLNILHSNNTKQKTKILFIYLFFVSKSFFFLKFIYFVSPRIRISSASRELIFFSRLAVFAGGSFPPMGKHLYMLLYFALFFFVPTEKKRNGRIVWVSEWKNIVNRNKIQTLNSNNLKLSQKTQLLKPLGVCWSSCVCVRYCCRDATNFNSCWLFENIRAHVVFVNACGQKYGVKLGHYLALISYNLFIYLSFALYS